jgi:hypothetical protein
MGFGRDIEFALDEHLNFMMKEFESFEEGMASCCVGRTFPYASFLSDIR